MVHKGQFKHSKAVVGMASLGHRAVLPSQVLLCHKRVSGTEGGSCVSALATGECLEVGRQKGKKEQMKKV